MGVGFQEICRILNDKLESETLELVKQGRAEDAIDYSKAISLKRIADSLERLDATLAHWRRP